MKNDLDFAGRIGLRSILFTLTFAIIAFASHSLNASIAVVTGGLLAFINFRLSSKTLKKIINPEINPAVVKGMSFVTFLFRYLMLSVVLYIAIKSGINPFFFLIGLSSVVGAAFLSYNDLKREAI